MAIDTVKRRPQTPPPSLPRRTRARASRSINPADGSVDRQRPARRPGRGRGDGSAGARQPARLGRARDQGARRSGSTSSATGSSTTRTRSPTRCSARPARCAARPRAKSVYLTDLINFYGKKGAQVHRRRARLRALPADEDQEAPSPVPPVSGRRRDQPVELPVDPLARRRDPRIDRGRGRRHQALRDHPARPRRDRRGLEDGDRRSRRLRRRQRDGRDRLSAGRRGRLRPVHRLRPHGEEGPGPRGGHPDTGERRARRQGPDDRPGERRRGARRQRRDLGRVRERRPGLHLGRAPLRGGARLRRVRPALQRGGPQPQPGHGRPRARQGHRRDDLPAPDQDRRGPRRGRSECRRDRPHGR